MADTAERHAAAPYADPLIFLFMGGFILALAMQRWGLDRRIALRTLRLVGTRPAGMVAGAMIATAVMSMFVSNTATAAIMLPIALSIIALVGTGHTSERNFARCLMLGIAYAATIGGIATKIGTPPNGFLLSFIERNYDEPISFVRWMGVGLPITLVFLPISWWLLTNWLYPVDRERIPGADELLHGAYRKLGPTNSGEWATLIVFCGTALAWMTRPWLAQFVSGITDAGIVMAAALLLFVIPVDRRAQTFVVDWATVRELPWGILILFGGGLSLAGAVKANGVAEFLALRAEGLEGVPDVVLVLIVTSAVVFLTELTSNTATTATLLPILAGLAPGLGVDPYLLIVPAALAASCAFMMPVATPPNAIVFASGQLRIATMCRAGIWLNLIAIALITLATFTLVPLVLGTR